MRNNAQVQLNCASSIYIFATCKMDLFQQAILKMVSNTKFQYTRLNEHLQYVNYSHIICKLSWQVSDFEWFNFENFWLSAEQNEFWMTCERAHQKYFNSNTFFSVPQRAAAENVMPMRLAKKEQMVNDMGVLIAHHTV